MSDGSVLTIPYAIVSIFTAWFTLIDPVLWGMAGGVSYPFNYLAMAVVAWLTISGVLTVIVGVVVAIVLILAATIGAGAIGAVVLDKFRS